MSAAVIQMQQLTKSYGRSRGIVDVNLTVQQGDVFGFIGPNGAGKSTTIRTLLGLISPTSGSAQVLGKTCWEQNREILREVGYMPPDAMFYSDMRVSELLHLSAKLRGKDCRRQAKLLCERLDVDVKKRVETLSTGNRRKVSIVCALQHEPPLYILDEPTSGLDPLMQKEFFSLLEERNRQGATIFLSSHILSEIQRHCRHAAIIREGRLLACDTVEALAATTARRVHVQGIQQAPALAGVRDVDMQRNAVSFVYQGDMQALIAALHACAITDVTIAEPDLEETFMHFYAQGGGEQ